jgi:8-oxo-dGTP pyrophosphatase MutT (NUDIX family)
MDIGPDDLKAALALEPFDDEAARLKMAHSHRLDFEHPDTYRDGSVLLPFFPGEEGLTLLLIRRSDTVEHHRRQIAFPGGARENGESLVTTALRETEEEVGIPPDGIEVLGRLVPLRIPVSGFVVHPFVGTLSRRPVLSLDPCEVEGAIEAPLGLLLDEERRGEEELEFRDRRVMVPFFDLPGVGQPPLWGATAMMLSGLLERIREVVRR